MCLVLSRFSVFDYAFEPEDFDVSRFTDIRLSADQQVVYATNRYDGGITALGLVGSELNIIDRSTHAAAPTAGADPSLAFLDGSLISGGATGGGLVLRQVGSVGGFESTTALSSNTEFAGELLDLTTVNLSGGLSGIYAGIAGSTGVARLVLQDDGTVIESSVTTSSATPYTNHVAAVASGFLAGTPVLISASATENGLTYWHINAGGALIEQASMGTGNGFWASAPTALEVVTIGARTFAIVAAATSDSLSVIELFPDGSMAVRDHIVDDLTTRFQSASQLSVVTHGDRHYLFASGSDDGLTAFLITKDGRLLLQDSIADGSESGLANISAIDTRSNGTRIDVFATSSVEVGVTWLTLNTGAIGSTLMAGSSGGPLSGTSLADVLYGDSADDTLAGQGGDDVIFDDAGEDVLTGGAGADLFVLDADDAFDRITDFELGIDRVDLGSWPSLRSLDQLFWSTTSTGITLTYGLEVLEIISNDLQPLNILDFETSDLIGPTRLPDTIQPGLPGPVTTPPDLPIREPYIPPTQPPAPEEGGLEILGTPSRDTLSGSSLGDSIYGLSNNDTLNGNGGGDILNGGSGADILRGGDGNDILYGGTGRDIAWALQSDQGTSDTIDGGAGDDLIFGQSGADVLHGGSGNDVLNGGDGRDTFVFTDGRDIISDFDPNVDHLQLDTGLWTGNLTASQVVDRFATVSGGTISFDFLSGQKLELVGVTDLSALTESVDFV